MTEPAPEIPKKKMQNLFEAYPHGTLVAMGVGCGTIAVCTLIVELLTHRAAIAASGFQVSFLSLPLGVATLILGLLSTRYRLTYGLPALLLATIYAILFVIFR